MINAVRGSALSTRQAGLVAKMVQLFGLLDAKRALEVGKQAIFDKDGHRTK